MLKITSSLLIPASVILLVIAIQFGKQAALACSVVVVTLWLVFFSNDRERRESNGIDCIVPPVGKRKPDEPVTQGELDQLSIPQDAPFQVPITVMDYVYIPKHPILMSALDKLADARRRRPTALLVALANIERFLSIDEVLKARKVLKIGNSKKHERAKQRLTNMAMLRSEALEQLMSIDFEFAQGSSELVDAVASIRDYTSSIFVRATKRWSPSLPGIDSTLGLPYGIVPHSARDVPSSVYR